MNKSNYKSCNHSVALILRSLFFNLHKWNTERIIISIDNTGAWGTERLNFLPKFIGHSVGQKQISWFQVLFLIHTVVVIREILNTLQMLVECWRLWIDEIIAIDEIVVIIW